MPPSEMYPWSTLENVGDYFLVLDTFKTYVHMNATIAVRNRNMRGRMKYVCTQTTYGCIVMLAQVLDHVPVHEVEILPGLLARTTNVGPSPVTLGNKPLTRELTQQERVNRMSPEMRAANLPWWYDPNTRKLVVSNLVKEPELSLWYNKQFNPGAETPDPEHYNLDHNLMIKTREQLMDEEDDDFAEGVPIDFTGDDDVDLTNDD